MQAHGLLPHQVDGDDQHLGGALEGVGQAAGVGEAALPDPYALGGERPRLPRVADADADPAGRYASQQPLDDLTSEQPRGSGHDDHDALQ